MIYKLLEAAEERWRKLTGSRLVALVKAGARFVNGELIEGSEKKLGEGSRVIKEVDPRLLTIPPGGVHWF